MKNINKKNLFIISSALLSGSFIFSLGQSRQSIAIWAFFSLSAWLFGMRHALTRRPCGHGFITVGKYGFVYPYVIKICPVCGDVYR